MAKQKSSNGIDIELIYVKNGHQACYMYQSPYKGFNRLASC